MNARLVVTLAVWASFFLVWVAVVPLLWGYWRSRSTTSVRKWQMVALTVGVILQFLFWFTHSWPTRGPVLEVWDLLR